MTPAIRSAFDGEMNAARSAFGAMRYGDAVPHLERPHVLGQRYFLAHLITHWWMLRVGCVRRDSREVVGQLTRILAVFPGYLFGWVPAGNTGGANVSAVRPMPLPADLAQPLHSYARGRGVASRVVVWTLLFGLAWLVLH